jgi:protease PrsW
VIDLAGAPLSLLPVLVFLVLLILLDSFKLVPVRRVVLAMAMGGLAALASLYVNSWFASRFALDALHFRRYVAPVSEELLKSLYVIWLIRARRIGFLVDAAICGFGVGAGFAVVENIYYLSMLDQASVLLWIVRGFGTAMMHGSTMAIFATLSKDLDDRRPRQRGLVFLPGLLVAIGLHSFFNHFALQPLAMTAMLFVVLPLVVVVVFERSENATRRWLDAGLDGDMDLLELILSGEVRHSRLGDYLQSLKTRFPGTVLADMLCLLRIHLELSLQAKAMLLARQAGIRIPVGDDVRETLTELRFLQKAVGKTGLLALQPVLRLSNRDLWQLYVLRN